MNLNSYNFESWFPWLETLHNEQFRNLLKFSMRKSNQTDAFSVLLENFFKMQHVLGCCQLPDMSDTSLAVEVHSTLPPTVAPTSVVAFITQVFTMATLPFHRNKSFFQLYPPTLYLHLQTHSPLWTLFENTYSSLLLFHLYYEKFHH